MFLKGNSNVNILINIKMNKFVSTKQFNKKYLFVLKLNHKSYFLTVILI